MHKPTFIFLMAGAIGFGLYKSVGLFLSNKFLFAVGLFSTVISLYGTYAQLNADGDFEVKWILFYLIPLSLLGLGSFIGNQETTNSILQSYGVGPVYDASLGKSADYIAASTSNFVAMLLPIGANFIAWLVQLVIDFWARKK